MNLQRKQTHHKPWAQKCPGVSKQSKMNERPLAGAKQNTQRSATKTIKRPLAAIKQTKPLTAPADKRAEKLRKLKNKKLRHYCARPQMLSREVNKVISGTNQSQSEIRIPRVKNTKVLRTQTESKIGSSKENTHTPRSQKCAGPPTKKTSGKYPESFNDYIDFKKKLKTEKFIRLPTHRQQQNRSRVPKTQQNLQQNLY